VLALAWDRLGVSRRRWIRGRDITLGPVRTHTTSLIAGTLFIAVGLLFVLTDGTAALGSVMGVDAQFDLQLTIERWVSGIDDLLFAVAALGLVAVVLAAWVLRDRRRARTRPVPVAPGSEDQEPARD
jgi:hypothetical protein